MDLSNIFRGVATMGLISACLLSFAYATQLFEGEQADPVVFTAPAPVLSVPVLRAYRLDEDFRVRRLPNPLRKVVTEIAIITAPRNTDDIVILMPANLRTLWTLQAPGNKAQIKDHIGAVFKAISAATQEILAHKRFTSHYQPSLQKLLGQLGGKELKKLVADERVKVLAERAHEIFAQDHFVENLCTKGLANQLTKLVWGNTKSVLADPAIRKAFTQRLKRLFNDKGLRGLLVEFAGDFTHKIIQHPEIQKLIGALFADPAFDPILVTFAERVQTEIRGILLTLLNVDGSTGKMHPLAGEVVQSVIFDEKRAFVLAIPARIWQRMPNNVRAGLVPLQKVKEPNV